MSLSVKFKAYWLTSLKQLKGYTKSSGSSVKIHKNRPRCEKPYRRRFANNKGAFVGRLLERVMSNVTTNDVSMF